MLRAATLDGMSHYFLHSLFMSNAPLRRWTLQRLVFLFPVLCLAASVLFLGESVLFQMKAQRTSGEVVRVYTRQGENIMDRGKPLYSPVLRYVWSDGKQTEASTGHAHLAPYKIGERHMILFNPAQKEDVRLTTFEQLWALPVTLLAIALATLLPALALWVWLIRPRIKRERERRLFSLPKSDVA
ncbi:MAG: DUF3592 domain-containing protein [Beijerinckiaceae bacterium]